MKDTIYRQAAIDAAEKESQADGAYGYMDTKSIVDLLNNLPSAQPETYKEKLKEIADKLSEKFAYLNTCPNERDIILGYLGVERPRVMHCDTDCIITKCECNHHYTKLPSAQPERQHGRIFKEIVVEYSSYNTYLEYEGKPYFSIKYTENGQEFIGYGTYNPEVLSEYLKEYFLPSAQSEIIRCKDCKYCEHWYADKGRCFLWHEDGIDVFEDGFCNYAERRTDERSD